MKFLNSIYGSWLKVALTAILTMVLTKGNVYDVTWKECVSAGVLSVLPIIINYLNPRDTRYGKKKKTMRIQQYGYGTNK